MPHADDVQAPAAQVDEIETTPEFAERRCWRCLQMFPGDAPAGPSPTVDFWLCDPCHTALIPQRPERH